MYKVKISQKTIRKGNADAEPPEADWITTEEISGIAEEFEDVTTLIGIISEVFPNTSITITKED